MKQEEKDALIQFHKALVFFHKRHIVKLETNMKAITAELHDPNKRFEIESMGLEIRSHILLASISNSIIVFLEGF